MDKGRNLEIQPEHHRQYSHFSPLSGAADQRETYHTVTIDLSERDGAVHIDLSQDNSKSPQALAESRRNWTMTLAVLKKAAES